MQQFRLNIDVIGDVPKRGRKKKILIDENEDSDSEKSKKKSEVDNAISKLNNDLAACIFALRAYRTRFFTTFKCLRLKLMVTVQWWKVVSWTFCKITYSKRNGNLFYSIGTSLKMYLARVLWTNWKTNGYQSDWEKAQKQSLHLFEATYCRY